MLVNIVVVALTFLLGILFTILQYKKEQEQEQGQGRVPVGTVCSIIATIFFSVTANFFTDVIKQNLPIPNEPSTLVVSNEPEIAPAQTMDPEESDAIPDVSSEGKEDINEKEIVDTDYEPVQSTDATITLMPAPVPLVTSITLNKSSMQLNKGESSNLIPSISPSNATNDPILWSSSDPSIVEVDSTGMIRAVGGGTAIVTASCGGRSCSCSIFVYVPVESLEQSQTGITMEKGDTTTYSVYIYPSDATNQTVTWSTSDPSIISVYADGQTVTLTGQNPGSAIITAFCGEIAVSQECKVFITATSWDIINIPHMENATGDWYELWLTRGSTFQIQTQFWPNGATNNVGCYFTPFKVSDGYGGATYDSGITVDSSGLISVSSSSNGGAIQVQGSNLGVKFVMVYILEDD